MLIAFHNIVLRDFACRREEAEVELYNNVVRNVKNVDLFLTEMWSTLCTRFKKSASSCSKQFCRGDRAKVQQQFNKDSVKRTSWDLKSAKPPYEAIIHRPPERERSPSSLRKIFRRNIHSKWSWSNPLETSHTEFIWSTNCGVPPLNCLFAELCLHPRPRCQESDPTPAHAEILGFCFHVRIGLAANFWGDYITEVERLKAFWDRK